MQGYSEPCVRSPLRLRRNRTCQELGESTLFETGETLVFLVN